MGKTNLWAVQGKPFGKMFHIIFFWRLSWLTGDYRVTCWHIRSTDPQVKSSGRDIGKENDEEKES